MNTSLTTRLRRSLSKLKHEAIFAHRAFAGNPTYRADVCLDEVLIGEQCGIPLERWVEATGEWHRASTLLKDSPYVKFLQSASLDERLLRDDGFLNEQTYFHMAKVAVEKTGSYFGACDPIGIRSQMRGFYETFASIREGRTNQAQLDDYRHTAVGEPLWMSKIRHANCYELSDGHHRASVYYLLGERLVNARIVGHKHTYLQNLVRQSSSDARLEVDQPIPTADLKYWPVGRNCEASFRSLNEFLGSNCSIQSVLHLPCGYGWFVKQWCRQGKRAVGVTPRLEHFKIGHVAYGLSGVQLRNEAVATALQNVESPYDLVYFESDNAAPSSETTATEPKLWQLLDRAAGRMLIVSFSDATKPLTFAHKSTETSLIASIFSHTSFQHFVSLGRATGPTSPPAPPLVACIR